MIDESKHLEAVPTSNEAELYAEAPRAERPEKRQSQVYEAIDKKLQSVSPLMNIVDEATLEQPQEELAEKLDAWYKEVEASTDPEVIKRTDDLDAMRNEAKLAHDELEQILSQPTPEPGSMDEWVRNQKIAEKEITLNWYDKKIAEQGSDLEVAPLFFMRQLSASLKKKHEIVQKCASDETFARSEFERITGAEYDPDFVEELRFDAFGVTAILDRRYEEAIGVREANGGHVTGSYLSFGFSDAPDKEEVVRHEMLHNIYDAWFKGEDLPEKEIQEWIADLPTTQYHSVEEVLKRVKEIKPKDIVNASHEEVVAHLTGTEQKDFAAIGFDQAKPSEGNFAEKVGDKPTLNFATAGLDVGTALATIESRMLDEKDGRVLAEYAKLKEQTHAMLVSSIRTAVDTLRAAKMAGKEADNDAHALIHILKPSQYKHMPKILARKYGNIFTFNNGEA